MSEHRNTPGTDYPINLRLEGKPVLVAGGGSVAEGRICALLVARAQVLLLSPEVTDPLAKMAQEGHLEWIQREVQESDVEGMALVLGCMDDPAAGTALAVWARERGIWVNIADDPPNCDFNIPSMFREGSILVTVSTSGQSPGFAGWLRRRLEGHVDEADALALEIIAEQRKRVRRQIPDMGRRFEVINALVEMNLPQIIRENGPENAKQLATEQIDQSLR